MTEKRLYVQVIVHRLLSVSWAAQPGLASEIALRTFALGCLTACIADIRPPSEPGKHFLAAAVDGGAVFSNPAAISATGLDRLSP